MTTKDHDPQPSLRGIFANIYMRDAIHNIGVWSVLFPTGGDEYLRGMWDRCAQYLAEEERLPAEGLALEPIQKHADWFLLPIRFPRPLELTEAFFGVIAVRQGRRSWMFWRNKPTVRYFLLELGVTGANLNTTRTVLGEWAPGKIHLNFGDGPAPELPAFLASIVGILRDERRPDAVSVMPSSHRADGHEG